MSKKNEPDIFEQMSIFQIMNLLDDQENTFSSEDISKIIDKLSGVKRKKRGDRNLQIPLHLSRLHGEKEPPMPER